nr:MAG: hypothetical protein [Bacteriophage sp.]
MGFCCIISTFENAAYGIEWTKDDNDTIRIGNAKFHRELPIQNRLKGCVYNEKKISYFLNPTGWAKPLENGLIPPLDGSDGDVGVRVPEFSACIKPDDTRYLGGNKSSSVVATKLQGRPRTGINYDEANEFCANRGDWITMIDYLEYCAIQALCYIEYANFDNQAALNTNLTSDGFKQGGLGAGVINLNWGRWTAFNGNNPIVQTYWTAEHNIGNGSTNGDHYELGKYNVDGSNLNIYPAVYRGILNFFGDIWTFIRDVAIINRNANYNSVYLLKKGVNHSDITIDNIQDKCYFIGDQANTNNFITEFDFRFGPYFVPNKVGTNKKLTIIG